MKRKIIKLILYLTLIAVLILLCKYAWKWLLLTLGSMGVICGIGKKVSDEQVSSMRKEQEELDNRIDDWKSRLDEFRNKGLMVILFLFILSFPSNAHYIPEEPERIIIRKKVYVEESYYIELKDLYMDLHLTAHELLDEAEEIINDLRIMEKKKDEIIDLQYKELTKHRQPQWGIIGGLYVDNSLKWKLGVGKRYNEFPNYLWNIGLKGLVLDNLTNLWYCMIS